MHFFSSKKKNKGGQKSETKKYTTHEIEIQRDLFHFHYVKLTYISNKALKLDLKEMQQQPFHAK